MQKKTVNIANWKPSRNPVSDIEALRNMIARMEDDIYSKMPAKGVNGVFASNDSPIKVITVKDGIITAIE